MFMGNFSKNRKLDYKTKLWIDSQLDYMNANIHRLTANDKIELYDFLLNSSGECLEEFLLGIEDRPRLKRHLAPLLLEVAYNRKESPADEAPPPIPPIPVPFQIPEGCEIKVFEFQHRIPLVDERPWIIKLFHNTVKFIRSKIVKM